MTDSDKKFISENSDVDVSKLMLNPPKGVLNVSFLVEQIQSRQKAKDKLPSWVSNPDLIFPAPLSIEQCSSEITASYKASLISGTHLVDLTGGMGVDTLAFSKQFERVTYVEQNPILRQRFLHNSSALGTQIEIYEGRAEHFLTSKSLGAETTFFVDPARRDEHAKKVFRFKDCSPNLIECIDIFKSLRSRVLVKASPLIDLKVGMDELKFVSAIHIVTVKNDCKEILFLLDFNELKSSIHITTINFTVNGVEEFTFDQDEEAKLEFSNSSLKKIILLPNASILKAGAFKTVAHRFGIGKISPNTHLYTSDSPIERFPGRQFSVLDEPIGKHLGRVNVITRNHPDSPEKILQKFKLKEGGDLFVIGFRNSMDKPQLVLAEWI